MKNVTGLFILISLFSTAFASSVKTKQRLESPKYSDVICKQKYIPMTIQQSLDSHLLTVKFTAQRKIDQFAIKNVRGIEGVNVTKFQEQNKTDIVRGEVLTSAVELSDFSGLAYVVFDVTINVDGKLSGHSIPIPVGALSDLQKAERSKNIIEIKPKTQHIEGSSPLSAPAKKVHEMQVD